MAMFTLSLELSSLRLVEFSHTNGDWNIRREEKHCFSPTTSSRKVFTEEIAEKLQKIKKEWGLSHGALHCILSSDFALLRVATFEKASRFISTKMLVQHDAKRFFPLPLEQLTIVYQKVNLKKVDGSQMISYAGIKTDFLEALVSSIQEAGFEIQKISLLPLSLCSLAVSEKTFLINFAERSINFLTLSPQKKLNWARFHSLGNCSNGFCEQATGLPLLLFCYLKKELSSSIDVQNFSGLCWITKTHFSENKPAPLALFLKKEFSALSIEVDPCLLLHPTLSNPFFTRLLNRMQLSRKNYRHIKILATFKKRIWNHIFKFSQFHITSIEKFTAPSIKQYHRQQKILFLAYAVAFLILVISPPSIFYDYFENKKVARELSQNSSRLLQRKLELNELVQKEKGLASKADIKKTLKALQETHDQWPLLINELQRWIPQRGVWITQLTPITIEVKEKKEVSEITALEIKGLYLEGMNGEDLVQEYAAKLGSSSLFIAPKKEISFLSCSKENGTAYAYPFSLQLQLRSPIQL